MLHMKNKHKIVFAVILVMLLQIAAPMAQHVYAATSEGSFRIVDERVEDSTAYIDWEFDLDLDNPVDEFKHTFDFTTDSPIEDRDLIADDGTLIGKYSISADGGLIVEIDEEIYAEIRDDDNVDPVDEESATDDKNIDEIDEENEVDENPNGENGAGEDTETEDEDDETEDIDEETEDADDETENDDETEGEDAETGDGDAETEDEDGEAFSDGYFRQHMVYASATEVNRVETLKGTIIIPRVTEKPGLFGKMMGLFGGTDEGKRGFSLKLDAVTDLDGNSYTEENLLNFEDEFKLRLEWFLENDHNYMQGDKATFDLPQEIKIQEAIPVELKTVFDELVANAVVTTDNRVELTFTDFVETHSNVRGWMEIISEIDEENAEVEDGKIVLKPIADEGEIKIPIDLGDREKTIEKTGKPNKSYNADEIEWKVIINKQKINLKNAKVADVLPDGTEYKDRSLKVTKLRIALNGKILGDLEEIETVPEVSEQGLTISLGETNDAYRIEYVTTVTNEGQKTFKNNVTLSDNETDDIGAYATVTINRGEPIKKSAVESYDPKTGIIKWKIEFNFNQKNLENVTLRDEWTPEGKLELVEDSLQFQEVTINEYGKPHNEEDPVNVPGDAKLKTIENGFEVEGITTDKAYIITYQTKVKERVLESFTVANTAGFGSEPHESGTGAHVGTYYGSKSAGTINYEDKTIQWKIEINHDEYPMEKISVKDTLGEGLSLVLSTLKVNVDYADYEVLNTSGNDWTEDDNPTFVIKFPEDYSTSEKIIITYKTKFDADNVPDQKPKNTAEITWMPEGGDEPINKTIVASTTLNKETQNYSWKNGSYNPDTKEITWTIIANYRENQIDNLIIKDQLQGNQKIIADSAIVKELIIASGGEITEGGTQEGVSDINVEVNSLEVNVGNTKKAYKIEYKTSIANLSDIQKEYINKAEVFDGDTSISELDAKVGIAKAHTYAEKSGIQNGKQVHWSVTVNPGQQMVTNLKLEDTISDNQEILADTFKVYEASVDTEGKATKKGELSSDEYVLTHEEGEQIFTVEWNTTVDSAFVVEYSTLFFAAHNANVTNSYKITGDSLIEGGKTEDSGKVTIRQSGTGGASGEIGYLIIDKVDTTYGQEETKLAGAEFDLIDAETDKVLKSGRTDENGQIDFGRLLFGEYKLRETKVPEGYVTLEEEQTITIDKPYLPGDELENFKYKVENFKPVFAIELCKTGKDSMALADVEFTLYDSNNNELKTATTDADGKILFESLNNAGKYYVQETKVPEGYVLDDKKHEVTIRAKEPKSVEVNITNNVRVGETSVSGEKTWKDVDSTERPDSIEIKLTRKVAEKVDESFSKMKTIAPDPEGKWIYKFDELDEYDDYGLEYDYYIEEVNVSENYKSTTDGYNITNVRVGKTEISGTKTWKDNKESDRPEFIKVNLLQDGAVIRTEEAKASDNWKYSFTDLDKYNEEGMPYSYTITEQDVPGYESQVDGNNITNTRSEKKSIEVTKGWLDDNSADRPESITVYLYQNKNLFDTVELKADGGWIYKFTDLEAYDEDGQAYSYTVKEEPVDGYETTVDGFNITNLRVGETEVTGNKTWTGGPNTKPTIKLQLYRNGIAYNEPVELENGTTTHTWTKLDKFDEKGVEYKYTIDEIQVPTRYRKSISEDGLTITNRYRPSGGGGDPGLKDPEEPEKPEDPKDPEDPTEPGEPEVPKDPEDPTEPGKPDEPDESVELEDPENPSGLKEPPEEGEKLPQTGETNPLISYLIGMFLILSGWMVLRRNSRKQNS